MCANNRAGRAGPLCCLMGHTHYKTFAVNELLSNKARLSDDCKRFFGGSMDEVDNVDWGGTKQGGGWALDVPTVHFVHAVGGPADNA